MDGFDYSSYEKWVNNLGIATIEFQTWLRQFLLKQAQRVVAKGKKLTPVDTGFLRNSWYIGSQKIVQKEDYKTQKAKIDETKSDIASIAVVGDYLQVEIGLGADYASYVELGTQKQQGAFMLNISITEIENAMPSRFQNEFKSFIKKWSVV